METIAPTPEWLSKLAAEQIEVPETTQTVRRLAYRAKSPFEVLYDQGKINEASKLIADKLNRHYLGSLGVNVSNGQGGTHDDDVEFPTTYHSQKLDQMRRHVTPNEWQALIAMIDESETIHDIGAKWLKVKNRPQAYIAGLALIRIGLDRLATAFGFSQSYHPPNATRA